MRKLKDSFRVRDDLGNEYEIRVYVNSVVISHTGGSQEVNDGMAHPEAIATAGPLAGSTFGVNRVDNDTFELIGIGKPIKVTRIA